MEQNIDILKQMPLSGDVYADIRTIMAEARRNAMRVVNHTMVAAYWLIGRRFVIEEQNGKDRARYGEKLLSNLSDKLTAKFGNGFSYANLRNMRQFYQTYPDAEICYTLCSELS